MEINTLDTKDANDHNIPIKVPIAAKMVTSMDGYGIDQVVHPQVTKRLPIRHSADVLSPLLDLIPSGIGLSIAPGNSWEGRRHGGPSDRLGWIIDEGRISDSTSRGGRHLAGRSKRI
jgi:hypothetical protein